MPNTTKVMCPCCRKETEHRHLHNTAYDIWGTHMAGTERYECVECKNEIFKNQAQGLSLTFALD